MPKQFDREEEILAIASRSIPETDGEEHEKEVNLSNLDNVQETKIKVYQILLGFASISIIYLIILLSHDSDLQSIPTINLKAEEEKKVFPFYLENYINGEVKDVLSKNRFYDIHFYMKDEHLNRKHKVLQQSETELQGKRELLNLTQTEQEIKELIKVMRKETFEITGKYKSVFWQQNFNDQLAHDAYFFSELNKNPKDPKYLEAEYYWYEKRYNISQYGDELPLCAIMIGKNNRKVIRNMYKSIENQNYTNFKVIHVDDGSSDGTIKEVQEFIKNSSVLSKRVTLIVQPRQMNSLYNRNFSYSFCGEDDIIVDMDSDDWLIGKQVFQLVNTVYQQGGNTYNKSEQTDTWAVYFNLIRVKTGVITYYTKGNVPLEIIEKQSYRCQPPIQWRTTHLRTFLHKIYKKVDTKDFMDPMTEQTFMIRQDTFIQSAIFELSAPKHIKFIDEFLYFYQEYTGNKDWDFIKYAEKVARTLPPYNPLKSLDDEVTRNYDFKPTQILLEEKTKFHELAKTKYEAAKHEIIALIEEQIAQE